MSRWLTGEAKQQFSEVVRRSESEPQEIYRRDRLVAAVISAEAYEEFERWRERRRRRTLAAAFDEVRELCARYDYELDTGERRDRATWADENEEEAEAAAGGTGESSGETVTEASGESPAESPREPDAEAS